MLQQYQQRIYENQRTSVAHEVKTFFAKSEGHEFEPPRGTGTCLLTADSQQYLHKLRSSEKLMMRINCFQFCPDPAN